MAVFECSEKHELFSPWFWGCKMAVFACSQKHELFWSDFSGVTMDSMVLENAAIWTFCRNHGVHGSLDSSARQFFERRYRNLSSIFETRDKLRLVSELRTQHFRGQQKHGVHAFGRGNNQERFQLGHIRFEISFLVVTEVVLEVWKIWFWENHGIHGFQGNNNWPSCLY
jgi:hypothetical protein